MIIRKKEKKPTKPVEVHPLDQITAYQDDSKLALSVRSRIQRHRECCDEARHVECTCMLSFVCQRHGKHCFGPHHWPWEDAATGEAA